MKRTERLVKAERLVDERKKVLADLLHRAATADLRASEKRAVDREIADAEKGLDAARAELERQEALQNANADIPRDGGEGDTRGRGPFTQGDRRISVGAEEPVYRPDARGLSFFRDVVMSRQDPSAMERLIRHQAATLDRLSAEQRDVTSADPGAAGFIPPIYLGELWAELPRPSRPFADVVPKMPLPDVGLQVQVPKVQSGTTVAVQAAENAAISETDIDSQSVTSNLVTIAGMNDISLQALERSFPGMDVVIFNDLLAAHDGGLDTQLIAGSGSSGQHLGIRNVSGKLSVTYTDSTPTGAELLPKIYDAIQQVATNRFRNATVIVMHPRRAAWLGKELSASFPLFQQGQLTQAIGSQDQGFVTNFGGLRVVLDPNIATNYGASTNEDEIYVLAADDLILMEGPVLSVRFDQVLSANLTVRLRLHSFSFFVPHRQPKSICVISGTGLSIPSF